MTLYEIIRSSHSYLRWIALLLALVVVIVFVTGWISKRKFGNTDGKTALFYTISLDLQFLLGLLLYLWLSPFSIGNIDMANAEMRFRTVEHPLTMLLAIVFAHIGSRASKKAVTDDLKFKRGAIWFALSLVFMLSRMPWYTT